MVTSQNLLLSEIQHLDPTQFSSCRVHYDGFAGKGRSWEYKAGGDSFEYRISPQQARKLSIMQDQMGERSTPELERLMEGIPPELIGRSGDLLHVTGSAQVALYDLLG